MGEHLLVVIDGPAGSGKSTLARALATRLGGTYLDTGAMFRALTLRALREGVDLEDGAALERVAREARLELYPRDGGLAVELDGEDVSQAIRTLEVTRSIRWLAEHPGVRAHLVELQRRFARAQPRAVVAEGRDLASVVFPDAEVKVYLDASAAVRAQRRAAELGPDAPPVVQLQREIEERDRRDSTRAVAPLKRVPEATYLDSSALSRDQVLDRLEQLVARAQAG